MLIPQINFPVHFLVCVMIIMAHKLWMRSTSVVSCPSKPTISVSLQRTVGPDVLAGPQ